MKYFFLIIGFLLSVTAAGADKPLRIVCLGDSITQSATVYSGYRYFLWKQCVEAGKNVDFVGSSTNRFRDAGVKGYEAVNGISFDRDHEGHWGWTAAEVLNGASNMPRETGTGRLSEWLEVYTADVALIHLGHNDVGKGASAQVASERLIKIIRLLQKDNPEICILLAKVIFSTNPHWNAKLKQLNAVIDATAEAGTTKNSKVTVVDLNTGFDPYNDTFDGIHPNNYGSIKMAQRWFSALFPEQ